MREPASTASGLTVFTRMPNCWVGYMSTLSPAPQGGAGATELCAVLGHAPADSRPEAARRACHQNHVPGELALRRCQLELVLLQRPVLDGVTLGVGERDEATTGFRAAHDGYRTVVKLGGDVSHYRVFASGEHAHAGDQDDTWMRIGCGVRCSIDGRIGIGIEVLLCVCFAIAAILLYIRRNACVQGSHELLAILGRRPLDEQRPGSGVNQVIR